MATAIIVAAGRGTRFGPDQDKLFLEVAGKPLIAHTWVRFDRHPSINHIVVVVRPGMETTFQELATGLSLKKPFTLTAGGKERQDSVYNGVQRVPNETEIVAIHDGARPCTAEETITQCIERARIHRAAVAAQPVTDTVKQSADGHQIEHHLNRSVLWAVQTPQCFVLSTIRQALEEVRRRGIVVTDDTAACETIGQMVYLSVTPWPNPKVTTRQDLPYIETLLRGSFSK